MKRTKADTLYNYKLCGIMSKKKTKRVDARRAIEGETAVRRQHFYESGAPVLILMLLIFTVVSSLILALGTTDNGSIGFASNIETPKTLVVMGLMFILSIALGLYIATYEPKIMKNRLRGSVLLLLLIIMIAFIRMGEIRHLSNYLVVIPVMITAIAITIAYNQRFALGISSYLIVVSILAMANMGGNNSLTDGLGVMLVSGCGTGVAIMLLKDIQTRTILIEVCTLAALVIFVVIVIIGKWQCRAWAEVFSDAGWGAGGAVAVGFIMQGILPLIERLFHTATGMTLLDYGAATTPLLKRLAVEAPGTFNHSWQIGMLAEAAAQAIGANGLLCRVGSYYHDVGKLNKPRYFVENQAENVNQHKELSPTMSRMIIIGHVKDGLALLKEYKIPRVLHQFAATHHGTTLVEYFYREAARKESEEGRDVIETEFRYPGPKPRTKESAIVMLADAVESATRALAEPTPSRIENLVHELAMKRLLDGQFNDCDMTMRDLQQIENSLVKSLCGMYHGRIAYPKEEKQREEKYKRLKREHGVA